MDKWNDELAAIQEKVDKVESICEQEIALDLETLETQRKDAQVSFKPRHENTYSPYCSP